MSSSHTLDHPDRQLLLAVKDGDHAAFEQLYHRYKRPIIAAMLRLLKSPVIVEEVVQELFMKIWVGRANIDADRPIQAYLYQIATNLAKNTLRKAYYDKKMREVLLPFDEQVYAQVDDYINKKENRELLDRILAELPLRRREVYILCKLEQLSYKEVALRLGISENAVNDHIKKANTQIRDIVQYKESLLVLMLIGIQAVML